MWTFKVVPEDGEPFLVTSDSRDVLSWERKTRKTSRYLMDNMPMEELYKIAHRAATRTGKFDGDLAAFESTCAIDIDEKESQTDTDPTQQDLTIGP